MKLSVCIIAKDEEKHIERCLKSIFPLVENGIAEIILVDTGSKDNTVEIAKKYVDKIYFYKWENNFSQARNYSISKAKGEYLLIIDADEEIEKKSLDEIKNLFNSEDYKKFNAFTFKEKNFTDEAFESFGIFTRAFIFRNSKGFFYTGSIHEQPSILKPCKNLNVIIFHYGYIMNDEVKEKKFIRNSKILKDELKKDRANLYYRYQLALTYEVHGDTKEAVKEIEIVINSLKGKPFDKVYLLYYSAAAQIYKSANLYNELIKICKIGLEKQDDYIDLIYNIVQAFYKTQEFEKALKYTEEYLNILSNINEHEIFHDTRFIFYSLGNKEEMEIIKLVCSYKTNKIGLQEFIENCRFSIIDKITAEYIIKDLIWFIENFDVNNSDTKNLNYLKNVIDFVFERTLNSRQLEVISEDETLYILNKYFQLGKLLIKKNEVLNKVEKGFFTDLDSSTVRLNKGDLLNAIKLIKCAVEKNPNMARAMEIYVEKVISNHDLKKQNNKIVNLTEKLKIKIEKLIKNGYIEEAEALIMECEKFKMDDELYSMKAVILIMDNNASEAEKVLKKAIKEYPNSFDLTYNLAYVYEISQKKSFALEYYKKSLELSINKDIQAELINKIKSIKI